MAQIASRGGTATLCLSEDLVYLSYRKPWLTKAMSIKLVLVAALLNLILQAAQVAGASGAGIPDWVNGAEHLGLTGALMLAVAILWRAYQAKDALLVESTKAVTEALSTAAASNTELRGIIRESVEANRTLREAVERLRMTIERNGGK
jgi:hypothetical protein